MIAVVIFISCLYDSFNEFVHGGRPERILRPLPPPLPSSLQSCSSLPSICFFSIIIIIIITDTSEQRNLVCFSRGLGEASGGYGPRPPLIGRNIDKSNRHIVCVAILWHHYYSHKREWQLARAGIVACWV